MCGRYALGIRAAFVRYQLQQQGMPVEDAPEDDDVRQTYNFAPGSYGIVYRADVPERRGPGRNEGVDEPDAPPNEADDVEAPRYKLQAMKWGLVPFWTKRNPDYGTVMKTINARDDSLAENRGMWTSMKKTKRCIIVAQGFYEWLKKNGGREKIPHYTKRKDGELMLFAGLWDCVQYEGSDERHWTYTIITTDSNKQLSFLHDRMPVILDNNSEAMWTWLDPKRTTWTSELQSLLKPYKGELECYAVSKEVGKVGNNSADFIVPVASAENKNNIANFFNSKTSVGKAGTGEKLQAQGSDCKKIVSAADDADFEGEEPEPQIMEHDEIKTNVVKSGEINSDEVKLESNQAEPESAGHSEDKTADGTELGSPKVEIGTKRSAERSPIATPRKAIKTEDASPQKGRLGESTKTSPAKKLRSATSNGTASNKSSPGRKADSSMKITSFFAKT